MARPIRWLHLSDLHHGCPGKELWEQVEEKLFADVEAQLERLGAPDLLIFTGDLAHSGKEGEYEKVDAFLDELLARLAKAGAPEPVLLAVPGNHDVARPTGREALLYKVLQSFDGTVDDPDVRSLYDEIWKREDASLIEGLSPSLFGLEHGYLSLCFLTLMSFSRGGPGAQPLVARSSSR